MQKKEEILTCSQMIRKRRIALENKNGYIDLLKHIILVVIAGLILFTQIFYIGQAPDNGMFPAIKDGDLMLGFRLQHTFLKDDVVVYEQDGKMHVGRILGQGTDVITLDDTGTLLVNGTAQSGEILFPTYAKKGIKKYPYTVPDGYVFVLGDYRTKAKDSRDFGCVKVKNVKAKVITILRRRVL